MSIFTYNNDLAELPINLNMFYLPNQKLIQIINNQCNQLTIGLCNNLIGMSWKTY